MWWNGEHIADGERVRARVPEWREGDPPLAWWRPYVGQERDAVRLRYRDQVMILDNEDNTAIKKVTIGRGSPRYSHRDLPTRSEIVGWSGVPTPTQEREA